MATNKNLDSRINEYSYKMINDNKNNNEVKNLIDKALGVLCNDGVYGYYVFCKSKKGGNIQKIYIEDIVKEFAKEFNLNLKNNNPYDYDEFFIKLSEDLHQLLFFKDIVEKILIYARYHDKALGEKK